MRAREIETGRPVSAAELKREGVFWQSLPFDEADYQPILENVKRDGGYIHQDIIELRPDTPDLETICAKFDDEHLHDEDEVRFILEGEGIFDIRSSDDRWIRVEVEQGDLIIVPAKRYHRFELTDLKTIRCVRLFQDASGWVPHYRRRAS